MTNDIYTKTVPKSMHGQVKKVKQILPQEVVSAFISLDQKSEREVRNAYAAKLHSLGWNLTTISNACKLTRERVRQLILNKEYDFSTVGHLPLPKPPVWISEAVINPKIVIIPDEEVLEKLKELQPYANKVRGSSLQYRREAEEYTNLVVQCLEKGVTVYRLSKLLGITHGALQFRLVRYGYKETNGKSKAYKRIIENNRTKS
jgi:hypothetical protein